MNYHDGLSDSSSSQPSMNLKDIIKPSPYKRIKLSCLDTLTQVGGAQRTKAKGGLFGSMLLQASDENFAMGGEMTMALNPES
jgi:hypothetical protein